MSFRFENLDQETRGFMLDELERDIASGKLYLSPRLSATGRNDFPELIRMAFRSGTDETLAATLRGSGRLNATLERRNPSGRVTTQKMPVNAPETLAEGEFNRFYARGVCRRAIDAGIPNVIVYRAKDVAQPRPASQAKIGTSVAAETLLDDLRTHQGVEPALGLPEGPNSGLSVRLP